MFRRVASPNLRLDTRCALYILPDAPLAEHLNCSKARIFGGSATALPNICQSLNPRIASLQLACLWLGFGLGHPLLPKCRSKHRTLMQDMHNLLDKVGFALAVSPSQQCLAALQRVLQLVLAMQLHAGGVGKKGQHINIQDKECFTPPQPYHPHTMTGRHCAKVRKCNMSGNVM